MANTKITDLTAYTDPASTDVLPIVDIGADVTKKVSIADLMENAGSGSAAAPGISFDGDPNTGIYRPGADQIGVATDGTARVTVSTTAVSSALPVDVLLGAAATPSYTFTGDLNTGIYSPGADQVAISTGGSGRLFVDSSGNVGVGAQSPLAVFHAAGTTDGASQDTIILSNEGTSANTEARLLFRTRCGSVNTDAYISCIGSAANTSSLVFANERGTNAYQEAMRIDSSGRLGLGTSSPAETLDVNGFVRIGTDKGIKFDTSASANDVQLVVDSNADLQFKRTNGLSSVTIQNAGNVGIGTTSPSARLDVNAGTDNTVAVFTSTDAGAYASFNDPTGQGIVGQDGANLILSCDPGASVGSSAIVFQVDANAERARIDSSGRLLVGTSTDLAPDGYASQLQSAALDHTASITTRREGANANGSALNFVKTRSTTVGDNTAVEDGDTLGTINFYAADGTDVNSNAASVTAYIDGTPGADDTPGRLVFATAANGTAVPAEALRITHDNVICYIQPEPISKAAAATLTVTELKTGIIRYTGAAASLTLPTGTLMEGGFGSPVVNMTFEWSVINTGSGTATIAAGTGHTIVGLATVATATAGRFASRRTAANTYVTYRLSS